jgi:acyl carrier protein
MHTFNANVQNRILALVEAILEQNSIAVEVDLEARLVDVGLTSMDMVNLMLSVEAEFDFTIPQDQITPENFQSIKSLELMIVSQLRPGRPPGLDIPSRSRREGID